MFICQLCPSPFASFFSQLAISKSAPPPHHTSLVLQGFSLSREFFLVIADCWGQALGFCNAPRDTFDCHNCYIKEEELELFI